MSDLGEENIALTVESHQEIEELVRPELGDTHRALIADAHAVVRHAHERRRLAGHRGGRGTPGRR